MLNIKYSAVDNRLKIWIQTLVGGRVGEEVLRSMETASRYLGASVSVCLLLGHLLSYYLVWSP